MRILLLAPPVCAIALATSSCGGASHQAAQPPPQWVQRANALCKVDDRRIRNEGGDFDSAAMVTGLQREATGLARAGFFRRVPEAAVDVATAVHLLVSPTAVDPDVERRTDKLLIRARSAAARQGVRCSFAVFPLQNL